MIKRKKLSWLEKAILVIGGMASAFGLSGCGSDNVLIKKENIAKPYVETGFLTDDVRKHGVVLGEKVRRDLVRVGLNDRLSAFIWQNYTYDEHDYNERDFGISYNIPINDKFSLNLGHAYWDFVSGTLGSYENVSSLGANYNGFVNLSFCLEQMMKHDKTPSGTRYFAKVSRTFPPSNPNKKDDWKINLTPGISAGGIDNFFGNTSTISQVTPGISVDLKRKTKNGTLGIGGFINHQFGEDGMKDLTYGGITFSWEF